MPSCDLCGKNCRQLHRKAVREQNGENILIDVCKKCSEDPNT